MCVCVCASFKGVGYAIEHCGRDYNSTCHTFDNNTLAWMPFIVKIFACSFKLSPTVSKRYTFAVVNIVI